MKNTITHVAMDTHKKEHKVALHYPGEEQIVRFAIKNTVRDIKKMVSKIKKKSSADIEFCYEAGVCGFILKRRIESLGCKCIVIAPSLTPIAIARELAGFIWSLFREYEARSSKKAA